MSEYRIREGIVLENICDRYVLISTLAAQEKCDYIRLIEPIVAFYWEMMEQNLSVNEMADRASDLFREVDRNVLISDIKSLIDQLKEKGYLLKDNEI